MVAKIAKQEANSQIEAIKKACTGLGSRYEPQISEEIGQFEARLEVESKEKMSGLIKSGRLYEFEGWLRGLLDEFHNRLMEIYLGFAARASQEQQRQLAARLGLGKLAERGVKLQLSTGHWVEVVSLYARHVAKRYKGVRHMLFLWWRVFRRATPGYYSLICLLSVLCPSHEVAKQVLDIQRVRNSLERSGELANHVAAHCRDRRAELSLYPGESVAGRRVAIGVDGGRSLTREWRKKPNAKGNKTFEAAWREPKLFVIDILEDDGSINRKRLPLYGGTFGDDETVALLKTFLQKLGIHQAKEAQLLADGAPWIWNRLKPMLLDLGVPEAIITETVDYYHASQYVHKIAAELPKRRAQKDNSLQKMKNWLWEGKITEIEQYVSGLVAKPSKDLQTWMECLTKNRERMRYADFRNASLMCGSGIIESGIRRVINLRFKNASCFWDIKNLEALIFLRGVLLAFRWNQFIINLVRN